jgi:hypothetical protein
MSQGRTPSPVGKDTCSPAVNALLIRFILKIQSRIKRIFFTIFCPYLCISLRGGHGNVARVLIPGARNNMQGIFRILTLGTVRQYTTQKGTASQCRDITLQALGGQWADRFAATVFDREADKPLLTGDIVAARLSFFVNQYNDRDYQQVSVNEIVKL